MTTWTTFVKVSRRGGSLVAGPLVTTCLSSCLIYTVYIIQTTLHHNQDKDEEEDDGRELRMWMVEKDEEQLLDIQHTTLRGNQKKDQEYDGDSYDHVRSV